MLWKRVGRFEVPAWQARRVPRQTHRLSKAAAIWVDEQVADRGSCGPAGQIEKLGAATLTKIRTWVGHHQVVIQPVLNMARGDAVDSHDPPGWMRDLVHLRDGHCIFPRCTTDARSCDLDHTIPYDPDGPPGHTRSGISPACAGDTTAPRPPVAGDTSARPTATTSGAARTTRRTSSPTEAPNGCPDDGTWAAEPRVQRI